MIRFSIPRLMAAVLLISSQVFAGNMKTSFGEKISQSQALTLSEAVKSYPKNEKKEILVTGKVVKVCEKSGCWMSLQDGKTQVRTLFKDYGFFVPKEINGKTVQVQGILSQKEISAATARHYLKDEGASMKEIHQIRKPQVSFEFVATGVKVI